MKKIKSYILYALLIYITFTGVLYVFQDKLIFFPRRITQEYAEEIITHNANVEEITVTTEDQVMLHGWLVKNTETQEMPLVIYYGGNADEVSRLIPQADKFGGYSLLLMNYRGYGLSQGSPNEKNLLSDAELIFEQIVARDDINSEKVVVMGRSIGSGVAVQMANTKNVQGVILITPYDSLVSVAQKRIPFVPVSQILKTRFDSMAKAPAIHVPLLSLIAENDEVIPPSLAVNLTNAWGGQTSKIIINGATHNTIHETDLYWDSVAKFLSGLND